MNKIKILKLKSLTQENLKDIEKIANQNFAQGYINKETILAYINSDKKFILVAKNNNKILGFCLFAIWNKNDLETHTKKVIQYDNFPLGVIKTIAIETEYQKQGIGTELFKESEIFLKKVHCVAITVPAWIYNNTIPMKNILNKYHYEHWFTLEKLWIEECTKNIICCSYKTTDGECVCDSSFYLKELISLSPLKATLANINL